MSNSFASGTAAVTTSLVVSPRSQKHRSLLQWWTTLRTAIQERNTKAAVRVHRYRDAQKHHIPMDANPGSLREHPHGRMQSAAFIPRMG
jgi:hypothetical protein